MTRSVWKFPVKITDEVSIMMPAIADILCVQAQQQIGVDPPLVFIWALVETESKLTVRNFRIYGTGHEVNHMSGSYIGTFQLNGGQLVFHLFEVED